ncbi:MAG TPA: glycogen debranching N-terminal domain-containing protein [Candidatus Binatia bacterium]|nr:glycogen debranching N-terminal domain-containing protein [Candidatus Binatia bacterium]
MSNGNHFPAVNSGVPRHRLVRLHPREDAFEVTQGRAVLSTALSGFIHAGTSEGLYVHQTRMLSCYRWLIDGTEPMPVALSNVEQHSWMGYYISLPHNLGEENRDRGSGEMAAVSEKSLELRLSRSVAYGVHEDVDLTNYTQKRAEFELKLELDADFADQEEVTGRRRQFGELSCAWRRGSEGNWELFFDYRVQHHYEHQGDTGDASIHRSVAIQVTNSGSEPSCSGKAIVFTISLEPLERWHTCIRVVTHVEHEADLPLYGCYAFETTEHPFDVKRRTFLEESAGFSAPGSGSLASIVAQALEQARLDLAALRLHDLDQGERAWVPAAGVPIFVALFGRDALTAAWEAAMLSSQIAQGTLPVLARLQGTKVDDWRDEQPGRMLHEAHTAPLATLGYNPRARYYGSATTSGFFPVVLAELWHWTGDRELVRPLVEPALKGLRWKDEWADLDGDGFSEYLTRSTQGVKNQGWKDSSDAIVYPDGSEVEPPISTCEEQAFLYVAKVHMSELLWWLDMKTESRRLYHEAAELKKRFNEAFWMPDKGYFALGLDSRGRQISSIASNAGHCVACGIADESLVKPTIKRLFAKDLFSGWGVRTLSADHPAYNPFSYHRGTVWPVEHGSFAIGLMRYGLHDYLQKMTRGMFEAAALFDFHRLPEVFSGHSRDERHPFPAMYPKTNWPQAWSCSVVFTLVQCMLGLYPYAPLNGLFLDPHLPEWLPEITVSNLHVGKAVVSIRFYREKDGGSDYEVLDKRGPLHVVRQPSPWSFTASPAERFVDALTSVLPGK